MPGNCLFLFLAGALTAGLFILMTGYFKKPDAVICCMCVAGAAAGTVYAGFQVNMLDIAPRNASVVMGIVNAASNTAGFLSLYRLQENGVQSFGLLSYSILLAVLYLTRS